MTVTSMDHQAQRSLDRIVPRLEQRLSVDRDDPVWSLFCSRLNAHFGDMFSILLHVYGNRYDFFYHLETIVETAAHSWLARSQELRALDAAREANSDWFQSRSMLGGVCYVDLFAGNLAGIKAKIPYFKELGLTYIHLMPLFRSPAGNSDGGYAVSSYREVHPALGTMAELAQLATELRHNGISLVVDFVFNHTSDEHDWALRALAGDEIYREYYYMFPNRQMPDAYERTLREIFPDQRPGSFTYRADVDRWVWTTFNSFQWDLNYANPAVFNSMAGEMLFLANQGVQVLRLDAVAFIWKQMGTDCENLPEAHMLIRAFNALLRIAAPALIFKSEAIVHPDEVAKYISPVECEISYNPLLMALLWNTLATRDVRLLQLSMQRRFAIDPGCAWVNYVRGHDDIGWTFDDGDAGQLGINGFDHRRFLNSFYTGRFPGSFSRGVAFQENPRTGDARVAGMCASLAGLEEALHTGDEWQIELSIRRIVLIHSVILSIGGIPLIYLGDEVGTLNDYSFRDDSAKAGDSRWVNRPFINWERMNQRNDASAVEGRIYQALRHLITLRKDHPAFETGETEVIDSGTQYIFGYARLHAGERVLVLINFSEHAQTIGENQVRLYGLGYTFTDLVTGETVNLDSDLTLEPYRFMWLSA